MRLDAPGNVIALEVRDADVLLAYFYTLDTVSYTLKQVPLLPEQSWWLGIEDAHQGLLFLHGYGDRKLGQHKGIKALDAVTHNMQWELPELTFYGVTKEGLVAFTTASPESGFIMLNNENAEKVREGLSQHEAAALVQQYEPERNASCLYPVSYLAGESHFKDVNEFIQYTVGQEAVQAMEYAESGNFIIVSYYLQQADNKLQNMLAVFDTTGQLVLKECLGEGLSGLGSDTFIIFNQNLYFIQHKDILKVYTLR